MEEMEDHEIGELIETPYLTAEDAEIRPGDECLFRARPKGFERLRKLPRLIGKVCAIFPGFEMVYEIRVRQRPGGQNWDPQLVAQRDILKCRPSLHELLSCL
jgi:hypothetical protein